MLKLDSPEYVQYIDDQQHDNLAQSYDANYLNFLRDTLVPGIDFSQIKVLDVGCRAFDSWNYFTERNNNSIVGIDIGFEGKEHCIQQNKLGFIELDAHRLLDVLLPETFDLVCAFHSLEHMYDMPLVLHNILAVLKTGGYLYLAVPIPSSNLKKGHWYDIESEEHMLKICKDAGLWHVIYSKIFSNTEFRPAHELVVLIQKR